MEDLTETSSKMGVTNSLLPKIPKKAFPYDPTLFASDHDFDKYISTLVPLAAKNEPAKAPEESAAEDDNKMQTTNGDDAFMSTSSPRVDLFFELSENFNATRMEQVLTLAWNEDPLATLKIIFNSRSIHLGKASRPVAYNALGWLYQKHPRTLLTNLVWLVRPVIDKTPAKDKKDSMDITRTEEPAEDFEVIEQIEEPKSTSSCLKFLAEDSERLVAGTSTTLHDVKNGGAHGYWKDLANILALAVNGEFHLAAKSRNVLNVDAKDDKPHKRKWSSNEAKEAKKKQKDERFLRATEMFKNDPSYRALHLTIARLFATQLRIDTEILKSGKNLNKISMAAKWAPSADEFHDKHTYIVSSIAELLHPGEVICPHIDAADRAQYLMYARWSYRKLTISPLRKQLEIVERDIAAGTFDKIKYERLPSKAMDRYQGTFIKKDEARFSSYLEKVASGNAKISGAVLLPSVLVSKALKSRYNGPRGKKVNKIQELAQERVLDGQWKSLVQRIKDSGTIGSAIAVCDVSGSMSYPHFPDGTTPMHSAIGLSLLLADVVDGPFGGHFISFHGHPKMFHVGGLNDKRSFTEKISYISRSEWGMNTNFVSVFEDLILPVAVENKIKSEDMIKQVFVFSDMEFDSASGYHYGENVTQWSSSFARIKKLYADAGYEMPTLVFWNLAGDGRGSDPHPKPVTAEEPGTALVSGYSQGQLKIFLEGGKFDEFEEEEIIDDAQMIEDAEMGDGQDSDENMVDVRVTTKQKVDPITVVNRAISHPAYSMLKVVD